MDTLFFCLCLNVCEHFEFLKRSYDNDKKIFTERHGKLLNLSKTLCHLVKPVIFVQFVISSMLLCVLAVQLVVHDSFIKRLHAASFGFSVIIQLFVYSFGGQLIMDKSSSVADDFYEFDRDFTIIIPCSRRPVKVTAWFYEATLPTFSSILSSTASLFTILKSFIQ